MTTTTPRHFTPSVDSCSPPLSLHHDSINHIPMLGCYPTHDPIYSPHTPLLDQFSAITSHTITHNAYPYTPDLLALERRGLSTCPPPLPAIPNFSRIVTPLVLHAWEQALEYHPDSKFRDYLTNGLCHGFRVGFNHALVLRSAQANMHSVLLNPSPVQEYLAKHRQSRSRSNVTNSGLIHSCEPLRDNPEAVHMNGGVNRGTSV